MNEIRGGVILAKKYFAATYVSKQALIGIMLYSISEIYRPLNIAYILPYVVYIAILIKTNHRSVPFHLSPESLT